MRAYISDYLPVPVLMMDVRAWPDGRLCVCSAREFSPAFSWSRGTTSHQVSLTARHTTHWRAPLLRILSFSSRTRPPARDSLRTSCPSLTPMMLLLTLGHRRGLQLWASRPIPPAHRSIATQAAHVHRPLCGRGLMLRPQRLVPKLYLVVATFPVPSLLSRQRTLPSS